MPSRLIRDGLLSSERFQSQPVEARYLFVCLLLMADDVGLMELNEFQICRDANLDHKSFAKLVPMLLDADLIRVYEALGKRWVFIPRYGQRLRITRSKCPVPPASLLAGDDDASSKINDLATNLRTSAAERGRVRPEVELEPEVKEEQEFKNTNTHPPAAKRQARAARGASVSVEQLVSEGVERKHAESWLTARRAKRLPLTPTAWEAVKRDALAANISPATAVAFSAENGWAGFKAAWLSKPDSKAPAGFFVAKQAAIQQYNKSTGQAWLAKFQEKPE